MNPFTNKRNSDIYIYIYTLYTISLPTLKGSPNADQTGWVLFDATEVLIIKKMLYLSKLWDYIIGYRVTGSRYTN